jgi:hypothetical protein
MGFFEGLDQEQYDRQYSDRQLVGRIIPYFRVQAKRIAVVTGMVLLIAVLAAVQPMLVSRGVDKSQQYLIAWTGCIIIGSAYLGGKLVQQASDDTRGSRYRFGVGKRCLSRCDIA